MCERPAHVCSSAVKLTARETSLITRGFQDCVAPLRLNKAAMSHPNPVCCQKAEILPQHARGVIFISAQGYGRGDVAVPDKDTTRPSSLPTRVARSLCACFSESACQTQRTVELFCDSGEFWTDRCRQGCPQLSACTFCCDMSSFIYSISSVTP